MAVRGRRRRRRRRRRFYSVAILIILHPTTRHGPLFFLSVYSFFFVILCDFIFNFFGFVLLNALRC